jgi:uncharacterized OsmC-like protein
METSSISAAVQRVEDAFTKKPGLALQPDSPAHAVLTAGLAIEVRHPGGHVVRTDMPTALGGGGDEVTPGWLLRAALASCTATVIAMRAERLGIRLDRLEVSAHSRSDARGLLGLGDAVPPGPLDVDLQIRLETAGVAPQLLADLVAWADAHSPVTDALRRALQVRVTVDPPRGAA